MLNMQLCPLRMCCVWIGFRPPAIVSCKWTGGIKLSAIQSINYTSINGMHPNSVTWFMSRVPANAIATITGPKWIRDQRQRSQLLNRERGGMRTRVGANVMRVRTGVRLWKIKKCPFFLKYDVRQPVTPDHNYVMHKCILFQATYSL